MTEILSSAQMRAIERAAIESGAVTGLELMERAGAGVVAAIEAEWPDLARTRAVVLCGPGNNSGDGFVVARLLHERGWSVRVLAAATPEAMPPDAAAMARLWLALGPVEPLTEDALRDGPGNDLYVDAIFGTGLSRAPTGDIAEVLTHMAGRNGDFAYYQERLVAVDAPSGLCLDSGRSLIGLMHQPQARLTVTFDSLKPGHVLAQGPASCGKTVVVDIGVAPWRRMDQPRLRNGHWAGWLRPVRLGLVTLVARGTEEIHHPGAFDPRALDKSFYRGSDAHKFTHGHALILSGGPGQGGAARLVARAALRIGAGLVTLGCPPEAMAENAARLEAVMLRPLTTLHGVLADRRITALCLGPGMGTNEAKAGLLAQALGPETARPVVLDADALTLLASHRDLFALLHKDCVLTPHGGEFARLFPDIAAKLAAPATKGLAFSKLDACREAAARAGCVVLFKGADTVIAAPDGRAAIHAATGLRAAPWLATAGSGDVLAGLIAGLMARGFAPFDAACTGAWLHVEAARQFGPGLIAEDLPDQIPAVLRGLLGQ